MYVHITEEGSSANEAGTASARGRLTILGHRMSYTAGLPAVT